MSLRYWFVFCICLTSQIQLMAGEARAQAAESASAQAASSDDTLKSQELMKQGAAKFARGDWHGAYEAYQRAWERTPHPAIAANMAATEIKLGQYLQAANHLRYALNHIPLAQFEKRGAVEEQLDQLREHLVAVNLSSNLNGVEIWIDGARIGRTPFTEDVLLEPGRHSIRAKYADTTQSKAVDLDAGAHLDLVFDLRGAESPRPSQPSAQVPSPFAEQASSTRNHTRTWVLIGGATSTAIGVGIGIAMRIQSGHEQDDAQSLSRQINGVSPNGDIATDRGCVRQEQPQACDLLSRSAEAAHRDRNISTGAFIAAGGLGLATVTTLLLWPPPSQSKSGRSNPHALRVGAWFPNRGYGLSASASF